MRIFLSTAEDEYKGKILLLKDGKYRWKHHPDEWYTISFEDFLGEQVSEGYIEITFNHYITKL